MSLCKYERHVLSCIAFKNLPDDPGAAWFAACEALSGNNYVRGGKVTPKGYKELTSERGMALDG